MVGSRTRLVSVLILFVLIPGILIAELWNGPIVSMIGPLADVSLSGQLFVLVPTVFVAFMLWKTLGHYRDRKPPS